MAYSYYNQATTTTTASNSFHVQLIPTHYNGMSSWRHISTLGEQNNDDIFFLPAHLSNSMNFFKNVSRKLKIQSWILVEYFISRLRKSVQIFRKNGAFLHTELEIQFHSSEHLASAPPDATCFVYIQCNVIFKETFQKCFTNKTTCLEFRE